MRDRIKTFLKERDMCVLATVRDGKPHCSLMAYLSDEEAEWVYMVTHRNTAKYANILQNHEVSLLVDNRCEELAADRAKTKALTVHGTFQGFQNEERRGHILDQVLARHPHMKEFLAHPEVEIISVRVNSFLFLDGITEAHYVTR